MLFEPISIHSLKLANHMVLAPMTRSRATPQHTPDARTAAYYGQRATAGLIIAEGTLPSPNGRGSPRIPGLFDSGAGGCMEGYDDRGPRTRRRNFRSADALRSGGAYGQPGHASGL